MFAIGDVDIVAFAGVAPVDEENIPRRAMLNAHAFEPFIVGEHEILPVMGDKA